MTKMDVVNTQFLEENILFNMNQAEDYFISLFCTLVDYIPYLCILTDSVPSLFTSLAVSQYSG